MKENLKLVCMGILVGLGKVIPGVSGSLIAVSLGIYEKAIHAISHFFQDVKMHMLFLGFLGIGIILSIGCGSQLIILCLEFFYFPTMLLFLGFIVGVLPNLFKKCTHKNSNCVFFFFLSIVLVFVLSQFSPSQQFYPSSTLNSYLIIIGLGLIDATTMVIPGISGTAIFMILGCYPFILNLFGSISSIHIFENIPYLISFGIGLFIGVLLVSNLVDYMLKKYKDIMYYMILGFTCSSIYVLFQKAFSVQYTICYLIVGITLFFIGLFVSVKMGGD